MEHTSSEVCVIPAYVSIRQHTSAYVSIRQHTSRALKCVSYLHTLAYVKHTSAYVSIRQHAPACVISSEPAHLIYYSVYLIYYWLTEHLMYHRFDGQMEHKNPKVCAEYFGVKGKIGYLIYC